MDNLDLNTLLSSPEAMEKVMGVVKSLAGSGMLSSREEAEPKQEPIESDFPAENQRASNEHETILPAPAEPKEQKSSPELMRTAMKVFAEYSRDDDGIRLLRSLRGHISQQENVEKAIEVLRLSRSIRQILGMLKGGNTDVLNL